MNLNGIIPTNFISTTIPTFPIFKSGAANSFANGIIKNAAPSLLGTGINIALGQSTGAKVTSFLGIPPSSLNNVVGSVITPGLASAGQEVLGNFLNDKLVSSGALGPAGPLVSGLVQGAVSSLAGNLLGGIFGGSSANSNPDQWFPGAGNEPDADYGGSLYTPGPNGPDVTFFISGALSVAEEEALTSLYDDTVEELGPENALDDADPLGDYAFIDPSVQDPSNPEVLKEVGAAKAAAVASTKGAQPQTGDLPVEPSNATWSFICAPDEISWNSEAQVERVQIFGTNQPPVISGSKGMRDLTLSNALVEGFNRKKSVEDKISQLEALMNFSLDTTNSYVKVPVYRVSANSKRYGAGLDFKDGAYFVMKSVNVKETMRDIRGNTTRAMVDVSFVQVPPYQVNTGRDIASKAVRGQKSILSAVSDQVAALVKDRGLIRDAANQKAGGAATSSTSGSAPAPAGPAGGGSRAPSNGPPAGDPTAAMPTTR